MAESDLLNRLQRNLLRDGDAAAEQPDPDHALPELTFDIKKDSQVSHTWPDIFSLKKGWPAGKRTRILFGKIVWKNLFFFVRQNVDRLNVVRQNVIRQNVVRQNVIRQNVIR
jgi:hypothetical protein